MRAPTTSGIATLLAPRLLVPSSTPAQAGSENLDGIGGVHVDEGRPDTVTDFDAEWRIPGLTGTSVVLTMQNLFDQRHRQFFGTPELGRVTMFRLNRRF